jgi:hypothetical protein
LWPLNYNAGAGRIDCNVYDETRVSEWPRIAAD